MALKRGEIYWVEFSPVKGSEQGGIRPALIVQNDIGNRFSPTTVIVAVMRTIPPKPYPFVVIVEPEESGLPFRSAINCAQMATIQQQGAESRLRMPAGEASLRPIGELSAAKMEEVDAALAFNLGMRR